MEKRTIDVNRVNVNYRKVIDIENVPEDVVKVLYTVIANSTRTSLNQYLASRGGAPEVISQQQYDQLLDLANMIADRTQNKNL